VAQAAHDLRGVVASFQVDADDAADHDPVGSAGRRLAQE